MYNAELSRHVAILSPDSFFRYVSLWLRGRPLEAETKEKAESRAKCAQNELHVLH